MNKERMATTHSKAQSTLSLDKAFFFFFASAL